MANSSFDLSSILASLEPDVREAVELGVVQSLEEMGFLPKTGDQLQFDFMTKEQVPDGIRLEGVRD